MVSLGEKVFWTVIALSTIGAAAYGYQRFKQIRPDLYGTPQAATLPENERKARIAEYQQKGDALTRAAAGRATRIAQPGETCVEGTVHAADGKVVVENGQPVHCAIVPAP
jgi:hypothetical protein